MGYNLEVGCHTCRVTTFALRGQEARVIKQFARDHSGAGHALDVGIDNGFADRDWMEGNPGPEYTSVSDRYHDFGG